MPLSSFELDKDSSQVWMTLFFRVGVRDLHPVTKTNQPQKFLMNTKCLYLKTPASDGRHTSYAHLNFHSSVWWTKRTNKLAAKILPYFSYQITFEGHTFSTIFVFPVLSEIVIAPKQHSQLQFSSGRLSIN